MMGMSRLTVVFCATLCIPAAAGLAADARPELRTADADRILEVVRESKADLVVVNVWATWCLPCREEFPDLLRLRREYADRGLELILVSGDFSEDREKQVGEFLQAQGVDFVTYIKEGDDMEFIDTLARPWTGALPATLLYGPDGSLRDYWEGKADYDRLERAVEQNLPKKEKP
jgi:thiol-disulfide isomerase/thioredoxin